MQYLDKFYVSISARLVHVVNKFRTSKGPPKFCIDLEADWLLILDKAGRKSPGQGLIIWKIGSGKFYN